MFTGATHDYLLASCNLARTSSPCSLYSKENTFETTQGRVNNDRLWMSCPFNIHTTYYKLLLSWMFCCNCGNMDCIWPDRRTASPPHPPTSTDAHKLQLMTFLSSLPHRKMIRTPRTRFTWGQSLCESPLITLSLTVRFPFLSASRHISSFLFWLQLMALLYQTRLSSDDVPKINMRVS